MATTFTDAQKDLMDNMCPVSKQVDLSDRWQWLTTAGWNDGTCDLESGTLTSATLTQCTLSSGTITDLNYLHYDIQVATSTSASTGLNATAGRITPYGFWKIDTGSSGIVRVDTGSMAEGNVLVIMNQTTATDQYICFSTAGTVTVNDTGDCYQKIGGLEVLSLICLSSAKWLVLTSAAMSNAATSST